MDPGDGVIWPAKPAASATLDNPNEENRARASALVGAAEAELPF